MKYSICEMNTVMKEMKIKSQLAVVVRASTSFHSTMCERNLRIMDLSGTEKNNESVEISIVSCPVYWKRKLLNSFLHFTFYCLST